MTILNLNIYVIFREQKDFHQRQKFKKNPNIKSNNLIIPERLAVNKHMSKSPVFQSTCCLPQTPSQSMFFFNFVTNHPFLFEFITRQLKETFLFFVQFIQYIICFTVLTKQKFKPE